MWCLAGTDTISVSPLSWGPWVWQWWWPCAGDARILHSRHWWASRHWPWDDSLVQHGWVHNDNMIICVSSMFILGEYVKDTDFLLLPQDPLLDNKFPRPLVRGGSCHWWLIQWNQTDRSNLPFNFFVQVERGYCYGIWQAVDDSSKAENGEVRLVGESWEIISQIWKLCLSRNRDCNSGDYLQPLSEVNSVVSQLWSPYTL